MSCSCPSLPADRTRGRDEVVLPGMFLPGRRAPSLRWTRSQRDRRTVLVTDATRYIVSARAGIFFLGSPSEASAPYTRFRRYGRGCPRLRRLDVGSPRFATGITPLLRACAARQSRTTATARLAIFSCYFGGPGTGLPTKTVSFRAAASRLFFFFFFFSHLFIASALALMADARACHSSWVMFQQFHSQPRRLRVVSHWLPFCSSRSTRSRSPPFDPSAHPARSCAHRRLRRLGIFVPARSVWHAMARLVIHVSRRLWGPPAALIQLSSAAAPLERGAPERHRALAGCSGARGGSAIMLARVFVRHLVNVLFYLRSLLL